MTSSVGRAVKTAASVEGQRSRSIWAVIAMAILALCFATGCGEKSERADVVIINGAEPESLDPHVLTAFADGRIASSLFEGLTRYNPTNATPEPGLAERWEISPDGLAYTFHLRAGLRWSTGEPITSEDVLYSWHRALLPATAFEYAGLMYYVKGAKAFNTGASKDFNLVGIHASDASTVRVELEHPTAFFLDLCAYVPYAIVPRKQIEKYGDRWLLARPFMASGPFTLEEWRLSYKIRVRKNPAYWDARRTASETIDLLPCTVATTALNLYQSGQVDIVWDKELVPTDLIETMKARPDFHVYDYLGDYFIRLNVLRKPLDDPRVRQALALAIDKRRIVERITRASEHIASVMSPPGIANGPLVYQPPQGLGYDPSKARKLLAAAGYPGGEGFPALKYLFNTQETHEKIGLELQAMWRQELGIHLELRKLEFKSYMRAQNALDYDLVRSSWVGDYNDPTTFLDLFLSYNPNNRTGWTNAVYDGLMDQARRENDFAKRGALLQNAERILVEQQLPVVPLFFYVGLETFDTNQVRGVFPNLKAEHPFRAISRNKSAVEVRR